MQIPLGSSCFLIRLVLLALCSLAFCTPLPVFAADLTVPSGPFPALQDAVDEAAVNGDALNTIYLNGVVPIGATIFLPGGDFGGGRVTIFRPVPSQSRATIVVTNSFVEALNLNHCSNITFRDLDILRNGTNGAHMIYIEFAEDILFERCRMGAISSPGGPGYDVLQVFYPKRVVVRNCIFFAAITGTFNRCLFAANFNDDECSLHLYNNVFADHYGYGVHIFSAVSVAGSFLLLRNNVVVNTPELGAEPVAYFSEIGTPTTIVTSHNVAFASAGNVESIGVGAESISGETLPGGEFLRFDRAFVDDVFVERAWIVPPPWDPNTDFYRLDSAASNPMHDDLSDFGVTVATGAPHARDLAVHNDIERDGRPGGIPPHTDRGADQLEPGISSAVKPQSIADAPLWASTLNNPADSPALLYRTESAGELVLEVFDPAGRIIVSKRRIVSKDEEGIISWRPGTFSGVMFYRLTLREDGGRQTTVKGKLLVIR